MSATSYLHSVNVAGERDIDDELLGWLSEAYRLRDDRDPPQAP